MNLSSSSESESSDGESCFESFPSISRLTRDHHHGDHILPIKKHTMEKSSYHDCNDKDNIDTNYNHNGSDKIDDDDYTDDDFDNVEWEDVVDESLQSFSPNNTNDQKLPHVQNNTNNDYNNPKDDETNIKRNKKRQVRKRNKIQTSKTDQILLKNIFQSHLLSLMARSLFISSLHSHVTSDIVNPHCSCNSAYYQQQQQQYQEDNITLLWNIAHSMIPLDILHENEKLLLLSESIYIQSSKSTSTIEFNDLNRIIIPPIELVHKFSLFFFDFINANQTPTPQQQQQRQHQNVAKRRKRTRGKSQSSNIGDSIQQDINDQNHESIYVNNTRIQRLLQFCNSIHHNVQIESSKILTSIDKVLLFICMTRSMGWRTRYVTAIDPIEKDLTINHPIFTLVSIQNMLPMLIKNLKNTSNNSYPIDTNCNAPLKLSNSMKDNSASLPSLSSSNHDAFQCDEFTDAFSWVEILCRISNDINVADKNNDHDSRRNNNKERKSAQHNTPVENYEKEQISTTKNNIISTQNQGTINWIHIDPHHQIFDQPLQLEYIRTRECDGTVTFDDASKTKKRRVVNNPKNISLKKASALASNNKPPKFPVSFVVAMEHVYNFSHIESNYQKYDKEKDNPLKQSDCLQLSRIRFTDVTPRYANQWSVSLRLRGATNKELVSGGGICTNTWWRDTIRKVNEHFKDLTDIGGISHPRRNRNRKRNKLMKNSKQLKGDQKSDIYKIEESGDGKQVFVINSSSSSDEGEIAEINPTHNDMEEKELIQSSKDREIIPSSKTAFQSHPYFVIPSVLKKQEVLAPDARKRMCGMFKGEIVFKRSDVSTAFTSKKWLYQGRKVRENEMDKPVKVIKSRRKTNSNKGFQALKSYGVSLNDQEELINKDKKYDVSANDDDGMSRLYGIWQTDRWSPPRVGPNDVIPVNEYKNVELELLNPGLVHIQLHRIAIVAKKLGIPYAPCLIGFEGHGGNRTPSIRGIVVHSHNADLLREAHVEWESQVIENEHKERRNAILSRWRRLVVGMLTQDRIDREYAND